MDFNLTPMDLLRMYVNKRNYQDSVATAAASGGGAGSDNDPLPMDPIKRFQVFFHWNQDVSYSVQILVFRAQYFVNGIHLAKVLDEDWKNVCSVNTIRCHRSILDDLPACTLMLDKCLKMLSDSPHEHAKVFGKLISNMENWLVYFSRPNLLPSCDVIEFSREDIVVGGGGLESRFHHNNHKVVERHLDEMLIDGGEQPWKFYCRAYCFRDRFDHTFCEQVFARIAPRFETDSDWKELRDGEKQMIQTLEHWLVQFKGSTAVSVLNDYCTEILQDLENMGDGLVGNDYDYGDDPVETDPESNNKNNEQHIDTCLENLRKNMLKMARDPDSKLCCGMRVVYYCEYMRQLVYAVMKATRNEKLVEKCFNRFETVFIDDGYLDDLKRYFGPRQLC